MSSSSNSSSIEDCTDAVKSGLIHVFTNATKTATNWGVLIRVSVERNGATGMGYVAFAVIFAAVMCLMCIVYEVTGFGGKHIANKKSLTVVIPESLDYTGAFDVVFKKYLTSYELINVKTTNMGSLFKLKYEIAFKDVSKEKEFIDELRCRNGNLEIICSKAEISHEIL